MCSKLEPLLSLTIIMAGQEKTENLILYKELAGICQPQARTVVVWIMSSTLSHEKALVQWEVDLAKPGFARRNLVSPSRLKITRFWKDKVYIYIYNFPNLNVHKMNNI